MNNRFEEDQEQKKKQKQNLKNIKLAGLILFLISIIFLIFKITIPGIEFHLELKNKEYPLNLTPFLSYIVLIIALILLNKELPIVPDIPLDEEIKQSNIIQTLELKSIPTFRIFVLIVEFILINLNAKLFGTGLLEETHLGQWFVLGGPAVFWPMSILYILSIPFLLIVIFTSIGTLKITEYGSSYKLEERRLFSKSENFVLKNDIQQLSISKYNFPFYPEYLYIVIFGLHGIWQLYMAYPYFTNPFTFGQGWVVAFGWLINGLFEIFLMIGLLLERSTTISFSLQEVIYKYEIFIKRFNGKKFREKTNKNIFTENGITRLQQFFMAIDQVSKELLEDKLQKREISPSSSWEKIVIGVILFCIGFLSRAAYVYAGHDLQYGLYFAGFYLITIGLVDELRRIDISLFTSKSQGKTQHYENNPGLRIISTAFDKQLIYTPDLSTLNSKNHYDNSKHIRENYLTQLRKKRISLLWDIVVVLVLFYLILDDMVGILKFHSDIPYFGQVLTEHLLGNLFVLFMLFLAFKDRFRVYEEK